MSTLQNPTSHPMPVFCGALKPAVLDDSGFTLIELLIAVVLIPIIVGALVMALISVFSLQNGVSNRISDSADAQLVSSNFESDVQSATSVTTNTAAPACGSNTQLLGLKWGNGTTVTYGLLGSELVRSLCQPGSSVPSATSVVSHDAPTVASGNITAIVTCNATLASPLLSGSTYTALSVSPLPMAVAQGDSVVVGSAGSAQTTFTASAAASAGATTVTVNLHTFTPTTSYPVGSQVYPLGAQVNDPLWAANSCGTGSGWISTLGVTGVKFTLTEPASNY
ncbi:MAG TPA: prepilin-type N-terminal cleavage/methylation domain-containing protein, partial [Acidimicrobiales bacterium]|nr:prepilin-type N-terminal cleavage/methylation domain-containing protein [Acidimicrobiales bacterium]